MQSHVSVRSVLATALLLPWLTVVPNALANLPEAEPGPALAADLVAVIECRADADVHERMGTFVRALGPQGSPAGFGPGGMPAWTKADSGSAFQSDYRLSAPITVFGHATTRVALQGNVYAAVLEGVTLPAFAAAHALAPDVERPGIVARTIAMEGRGSVTWSVCRWRLPGLPGILVASWLVARCASRIAGTQSLTTCRRPRA